MKPRNTLDMTEGPIVKKILQFVVPIVLSSLLQRCYTIADSVVVGNFSADGTAAQAAIGATLPAINMMLNLFLGLSIGANVVCAKLRGARDYDHLRKAMHTALLLAVALGITVMVLGISLSPMLLSVIRTPKDIETEAQLYMWIVFAGQPAAMVYNFCAAIMRAHGDTRRSMYILAVTGLVNVGLNLVLVIGCHWDVAGVAVATAVANCLSAMAALYLLFSKKGEYKLSFRELRPNGRLLWNMVSIGVPCGINGTLQSCSNLIVQSAVNDFGAAVIAGNNAATNINCFPYLVNDALAAACVSATGQCYGAKVYKRIDKLLNRAILLDTIAVLALAAVITVFAEPLLGIFNPDPLVTQEGMFKVILLSWTTVLFGIAECLIGVTRGMGRTVSPTVINIISLCGLRLLWALVIFPMLPHEPEYLYLCFPISWLIGLIAHWINYRSCRKRMLKKA